MPGTAGISSIGLTLKELTLHLLPEKEVGELTRMAVCPVEDLL